MQWSQKDKSEKLFKMTSLSSMQPLGGEKIPKTLCSHLQDSIYHLSSNCVIRCTSVSDIIKQMFRMDLSRLMDTTRHFSAMGRWEQESEEATSQSLQVNRPSKYLGALPAGPNDRHGMFIPRRLL